jgi:hypothetical protein
VADQPYPGMNGSKNGAATAAPAARVLTIVGWISALAVCLITTLLLISIVHGYVLAIHHQLPPNNTFGFRDATTQSCLPAWYAAQKAGFSWLLFGGGPILTWNIVFAVVAVIQRRSPWDVYAMSTGTTFLLIIVVVVAGIHADGAARAITASAAPLPALSSAPQVGLTAAAPADATTARR